MTFKIKDSLSVDGSVVIDQNKNITANDVTVNGTLTANGSAVQPQLVSGTNIKTVNGASLLGAGNIDAGGGVNGIIKSNGSAVYSAAVAGTDFVVPSGNVATATKLATARNLSITGDATAAAIAFDGTANAALSLVMNSGLTPGRVVSIAGSVDLNTLTSPGFYYQSTDANAASGTNYPEPKAGTLLVFYSSASNGYNQIYIPYSGSTADESLQNFWFRGVYNGTWDAWKKLAHSGNLKTVAGISLFGSGDLAPTFASLANKPSTLSGYGITDAVNTSLLGAVSGVATLDGSGKVPSAQLPSYVDDVVEYANLAAFPGTGSSGVIYVTQDTNKIYRWSGSAYVEISPVAGNSDTATKLSTARTISTTGDATWSVSFDGSANVSSAITLANSGATAGTYNNSATALTPYTIDAKGRITATGSAVTITPAWTSITSKPTTVSGYGITDAYTADSNLFTSTRYSNGGAVILRTAAGTQGTPTAISTSSTAGLVVTRAYDGTTYRDVASINVITDGAVSSTSSPGYVSISTTPSGSVASSERLRISSTGAIGLSGANYGTSGQLLASNGSASAPTWSTIKTVNGSSLLGSGNVDAGGGVNGIIKSNGAAVYSAAVAGTDFQAPLVSGTNIKTVNGTTLLGSGDLVVAGSADTVSVVSANTNAVKSTIYVVTAAATITLPAAPAAGDRVSVVNRSGSTAVIVASNGLNVLGSVQDITLDVLNIFVRFTYSDATNGWIID